MRRRLVLFALFTIVVFACHAALAGGPKVVGGPAVGTRAAFGLDGQAFIWNPARMPIAYRLDPGPMAATSSGTVVIDHAAGAQRVQNMLGVWQAVSTATISFTNAGPILAAGSYTGGDLKTAQQFNDVMGSCSAGTQSPVIFDADGKLIASLGLPPEVIGFNSSCAYDRTDGYYISSAIVMNGVFQDGVNSSSNFELSASAFDEAITHEMGHLLGLDHSQINLNEFLSFPTTCDVDQLAGLPLMFPISFCQARKDGGLPTLSPDDVSWISRLYPNATTLNEYGTISGIIYFADGVTPLQGANVIARLVDDPSTSEDESRRVAVSAVSGYLFTGNPGQSLTASLGTNENNTNGSQAGSRTSSLIGYYEIAVPPGTYTVEVESIFGAFVAGSGVGPLDPPIPIPSVNEFWNQDESAFDFPLQRDTITIHPGDKTTGIDIILNSSYPRFDQFEDSGRLFDMPIASPLKREEEMPA
jgi:hypothetical protein